MTHFNIIIIGAGLSGIGAACHLQKGCPGKNYAILEARERIGGTWDLFQYPGIRSDSDMYTLGYVFKPWVAKKAIADGSDILNYIKETAEEYDVKQHIHFNKKIVQAAWNSNKSEWALTTSQNQQYTCNFLINCTGYYNYDEGHTPDFAGIKDFKGKVIHPQHWDTTLDYSNTKMIVIGSGATAVTLVPELAKKAAKVTMLQRSPSYVMSMPASDMVANTFQKILPSKLAYSLARWKNITVGQFFYNACKRWPNGLRKLLTKGVRKKVGNHVDVDTHFNPKYNPWEQRLCLIPDDDMFNALNNGSADIVTDHIDRFTENGILLQSGKSLEADIIVTATGLKIQFLGGMKLIVDNKKITPGDLICYKGMMFNDIPNLVVLVGYTNASWTLKCDLSAAYICRLLNDMDKSGANKCYPSLDGKSIEVEPILDFNSGYVLRALDSIPKQGTKSPWKLFQNYFKDLINFKYSKVRDEVMKFEP